MPFQSSDAGGLATAVYHHRASKRDDVPAILVEPGRANRDDADVVTRRGFALLEHLRARVHGVAFEDRVGQSDLVPAEVGQDVLGDVGDALARDQGEREGAVYQWLAELGLARVVVIEVDRRGVLGQQSEPDVVRGRDGPAQGCS